MRRFLSADPKLVLLLGLTVFGAFAWLTRHPDSELLRHAEQWPVLGSLASGFRAAYSSSRSAEAPGGGCQSEVEFAQVEVLAEAEDSERASARPQVWVEPGVPIQVSPHSDSEVLAMVELLGNYSVIERRGDWFHIHRYFADHRVLDGWILIDGYEEPSSERLQRPDPVLPLAAVRPEPERVRRARSFMEGGGVELPCGGYFLYTDTRGSSLSEDCGQLASQLEEIYRDRFGLTPVSDPAEAIFLFRTKDAYEAFSADFESLPAERDGHAAPARGYLALHSENLPREAVVSTLVHELTHMINRRALGPALPPWLSEGLADDLAESRLDEFGRLIPGELGGYRLVTETMIQEFGGGVSARKLIEALDSTGLPELRDLVHMGSDEFHGAQREALLYALSSFWVRYLLSAAPGSEPAGFRGYLEAVARGESITPDLLVQHLGGDWSQLEAGFLTWVRFQAAPLPKTVTVDR